MKIITYIALIPLVILAITPPMDFALDCKVNSTFWLWMTFFSGFLAFLYLYQKVSVWLRLLVVWCFISCFISRAPYVSFTMYWSLIICAWYYALCRKINDFTPVKKALQAVFLFFVFLIIVQLFGKDSLLNFRESAPDILHRQVTPVFGMIGNKMIASSFVCILSPFLIFTPLNWVLLILVSFISWSSGAVLSIGVGLSVYAWARLKKARNLIIVIAILTPIIFAGVTHKYHAFTIEGRGGGREQVWVETLKLSLQHPEGYGIATYKVLFPVMTPKIHPKDYPLVWNTAHNDWLQMLFETGFIGMFLLIGWIVDIVRKVKDPVKVAGLAILATNMMIHFPLRMVQCAFIILMFLAYCEKGEGLWEA